MASAGPIQAEENTVERSVIVENIPFVTDDIEELKNKLTVYFQKSSNGGGDVEEIICPLKGSMRKAIVKFDSTSDAMNVIRRGNHCFFDSTIDVEALPPVFLQVFALTDNFYWSAMTKAQSEAVADQIKDMLDKPNNYEKKAHAITRVGCSWDQLKEIRRLILEGGPLGSLVKSSPKQTTQSSILKRSIILTDIPYITDDKQQLLEYLETYIKGVIKSEVETLICGIKGDLKEAVAVFRTIEDMALFFDKHEDGKDDVKFLEETVTVKKIPPVISNVSAKCGDFYLNIIPRVKRKRMIDVMMERCGFGLIIKDDFFSGSLHQICVARTIIMETISLQHPSKNETNVYRSSSVTEKTNKDVVTPDQNCAMNVQPPTVKEDDAYRESALGRGKIGPVLTSTVTTSQDSIPYMTNDETTDGSTPEQMREAKIAVDTQPHNKAVINEGDEFAQVESAIYKYVVKKRKDEFDAIEASHGVTISAKPTRASIPNELTAEVKRIHGKGETKTPNTNHVLEAKREFLTLYSDTIANITTESLNIGHCAEKLTKAEQMLNKKFTDILLLKENITQYIFCGNKSTVNDGIREFCLLAGIRRDYTEHFTVDKIGFQFLKRTCKDKLNALEKKYSVYVELNKDSSRLFNEQLQVQIKPDESRGQKKRNTAEEMVKAKDAFVTLYQNAYLGSKRVTLNCQGVRSDVHKEAAKTIRDSFPDILIVRLEHEGYLLCGEEMILERAIGEFQIMSGLLPTGRKLKKTNPMEEASIDVPEQTTSNELLPAKKAITVAEQPRIASDDLPSVFATNEGIEVIVLTGDITKQQVNVIVNAANSRLNHSMGGVAKAISIAAGAQLQRESDHLMYKRKLKNLMISECIDTRGYNLPCDRVVHAVGPVFTTKTNVSTFTDILKKTFVNVLKHADGIQHGKTIAIPLISSGNFGGSKDSCAEALASALNDFSQLKTRKNVAQVYLVNIDKESTIALQQSLFAKFPSAPNQNNQGEKNRTDPIQIVETLKTKEGLEVVIARGDIRNTKVDLIVNVANEQPLQEIGVAGVISKATGRHLQEENDRLISQLKGRLLHIGEIVETDAIKLPCKKLLHVVGPKYNDYPREEMFSSYLKQTFLAVLKHANSSTEASSIALPLISSGESGGSKKLCSEVLAEAVNLFSENEATLVIKTLFLIDIDVKATEIIYDAFQTYFTRRYPATTGEFSENVFQFKTAEGILINAEESDITKQRIDGIVNLTDGYLKHNNRISNALLKAAGTGFKYECEEIMKKRGYKYLQSGEVVHTTGGDLPCKTVLHTMAISPFFSETFSNQKYIETTFVECLKSANWNKLTSVALPLMGAGQNIKLSDMRAIALAKAIEIVSRIEKPLALKQIKVVSYDHNAFLSVQKSLGQYFQAQDSGKNLSTIKQVTQPYQTTNPNQASNIPAGTSASSTEVTSEIIGTTIGIRCQICQGRQHLKCLESCGHTFCEACIKKDIAPKSSCYICKALYCVTEEKTLNGTMTYYCRSDIELGGEIHSGAIIIVYEFPSGFQKPTHPNPGKPYNGTRSLAYLPYNKDGCEVVHQLRTAFVAGITFDVKPNNAGGHEVRWSGLIPHKRNRRGGIRNLGYPDTNYIAQVKAALDKELRKINRKPQGSSF